MSHRELLHLQEQVAECRELNSTEVWLAVASAVNPLCQSMPLLLHHQVKMTWTCIHLLECLFAATWDNIGYPLACNSTHVFSTLIVTPATQCVHRAAYACGMMCRPTSCCMPAGTNHRHSSGSCQGGGSNQPASHPACAQLLGTRLATRLSAIPASCADLCHKPCSFRC